MMRMLLFLAWCFIAATNSCIGQTPSPPNATSSFAVVSVKLSPDNEADDWGIGTRDGKFWATHVTVNELIGWSYGLNAKQLEHAPDWLASDHFDVNGLPDAGLKPSSDQIRAMVRSALAERFALKSHSSSKVLSIYVLSVAPGGLKIPEQDDPAAKGSLGIHGGLLSIKNMTFRVVAQVMQRTVFDRPVIDETNLKGTYSFILKWRPDETQFSQMQGVDMPKEAGTDDLADIYTAAREQLGIKIEAKKQQAPTMVIDNVSHPTPN